MSKGRFAEFFPAEIWEGLTPEEHGRKTMTFNHKLLELAIECGNAMRWQGVDSWVAALQEDVTVTRHIVALAMMLSHQALVSGWHRILLDAGMSAFELSAYLEMSQHLATHPVVPAPMGGKPGLA